MSVYQVLLVTGGSDADDLSSTEVSLQNHLMKTSFWKIIVKMSKRF